jgi:membrane protein YqaA with SNARE-associated domain
MNQKSKTILFFFLFAFLIVSFSVIVSQYSPEEIQSMFGEEHAYLALFVSAFVGGTSVLFPFPYFVLSFSFGALGFHPVLLGLFAGLGTALGDSITYFMAKNGRTFASEGMKKRFEIILATLSRKHPKLVPLFIYAYTAFLPLSDDLIVIPAGLIKYPYKKMIVSAFLGKVTFNTLVALAGWYGWQLFF